MNHINKRRAFLKNISLGTLGAAVAPSAFINAQEKNPEPLPEANSELPDTGKASKRRYNSTYKGGYLNRLAFPIGGMGAGMFCLEGTGAISHMSIRNSPNIFNEPSMFAAIMIKGLKNGAKVLEGPVPEWKHFGRRGTANGAEGTTFGLPRFSHVSFTTAFPFAHIELKDDDIPLKVSITGWSPFIPTDEDNSSLPAGALEYSFINSGTSAIEAMFSYNSKNFTVLENSGKNSIQKASGGFTLKQDGTKEKPEDECSFSIVTDQDKTIIDHCWFRGGWWDPLTMAWNAVKDGNIKENEPVDKDAPGASLYVPFTLKPGAKKTIRVMMCWYVPESNLHVGEVMSDEKKHCDPASGCCATSADMEVQPAKQSSSPNYKPWYSSKFENITQVINYWKSNYPDLFKKTKLFSNAFYSSTLPPEVTEAVAANLTILKSPTVLRQYDGRLWSWEGCADENGCCHGSCTHVWNYAQAVPHLFPSLEKGLRNTEFCENQNMEGHQGFRTNMPIAPLKHDFYAAADGQLGGIMKVYREWRISGDSKWLEKIFPMVRQSMDYCMSTWDPRNKGVVEEPHHNTYDIEFWGPDGMCTSFYLGALKATILMGTFLKKNIEKYEAIFNKGKQYLETNLFNGNYFMQEITYKGLNAPDPATSKSFGGDYSKEAIEILKKEGPKYQYGTGCLSDGVLGVWIGRMCGLDDFIDPVKVRSHLTAVHEHNLKKDLSEHANPQRPSYALGHEGGLLLCTWPKGGKLSLPFVYSDEVWTGIEYQVASHLMLMGNVQEGLEIVRTCRDRYDGRTRNPFNEYECGHWYARAMSSYGLIQGLTGVRYDAVDKTLYINSRVGDFKTFISTATGFGNVRLKDGRPSLEIAYGSIDVQNVIVAGKRTGIA